MAKIIKLDGSHGLGVDAVLTVTTKDPSEEGGKKIVSYRLPFGALCFDQLNESMKVGLILGYSVEKDIDHEMEKFFNENPLEGFGLDSPNDLGI